MRERMFGIPGRGAESWGQQERMFSIPGRGAESWKSRRGCSASSQSPPHPHPTIPMRIMLPSGIFLRPLAQCHWAVVEFGLEVLQEGAEGTLGEPSAL